MTKSELLRENERLRQLLSLSDKSIPEKLKNERLLLIQKLKSGKYFKGIVSRFPPGSDIIVSDNRKIMDALRECNSLDEISNFNPFLPEERRNIVNCSEIYCDIVDGDKTLVSDECIRLPDLIYCKVIDHDISFDCYNSDDDSNYDNHKFHIKSINSITQTSELNPVFTMKVIEPIRQKLFTVKTRCKEWRNTFIDMIREGYIVPFDSYVEQLRIQYESVLNHSVTLQETIRNELGELPDMMSPPVVTKAVKEKKNGRSRKK